MSITAAVWLLVILGVVAANLPWLSERLFLVVAAPPRGKPEWARLLEWLLLYGLVGVVALGLERRFQGTVHDQGWEFYVVTLFLFAVFALPGFIYHHDLRRHLRQGRGNAVRARR